MSRLQMRSRSRNTTAEHYNLSETVLKRAISYEKPFRATPQILVTDCHRQQANRAPALVRDARQTAIVMGQVVQTQWFCAFHMRPFVVFRSKLSPIRRLLIDKTASSTTGFMRNPWCAGSALNLAEEPQAAMANGESQTSS